MIFKDLYGQKEEIEQKDYYDYEEIPKKTRQKIAYILLENCQGYVEERTSQLRYELCKHLGIPIFYMDFVATTAIQKWILIQANITEVLRTVEMFLELQIRSKTWVRMHEKTIEDLNDIFSIDKIGYKINKDTRRIIRIDSEVLHETAIKKSRTLLHNNEFNGALSEFDKALDKYTQKDYSGTITEANKAYESTMISILTKLGKPLPERKNVGTLLTALEKEKLITPKYLKDIGDTIKTVLEKGLPSMRNEGTVAHGTGLDKKEVERSYAHFALNLAGTFIVFLMERYEEYK